MAVGQRVFPESAWTRRKSAALIKILALAPRFQMHREQVLDLLWPDLDPKAAANNLHYALHVVRRLLAPLPDSYVCLRSQMLSLGPPDGVQVDAEMFEEQADRALRSGSLADLESAISLYTGDLLPGDVYEEWTLSRREALAQLRLSLLRRLATEARKEGNAPAAINALQRTVAAEPTLEEAHVELMELYAEVGQRQMAIRQFDRLRETLRRELDIEPDPSTVEAYDRIVEGAQSSAPGPRSRAAPASVRRKHNLPGELTSFVGRAAETEEVRRLLAAGRLVTLIGPGGAGKTRLALHVAREVLSGFRDGVWLVELAAISDAETVPAAVAEVVSAADEDEPSTVDALVHALESRQLLLVVDNCEHLVDAAARLTQDLLTACPEICVLATSREPLGIPGESIVVVPPLPVPQPRTETEDLLNVDAVCLLVDRIRYRQPGFEISGENASAISSICSRLDGLPLALELAASRVGSLSLGQIRDRLSDALDLLTTGSRTADARQRTLRGALDWSHELLTQSERDLFMRLSVFRGGWTLNAATTIGGAAESAEQAVLDVLSRLVDRSLVVAEPSPGEEIRYRLLEPIRQYAAARLEARGETAAMRSRHASLFLAFAERGKAELSGPGQVEWLQKLEREHDNLRAALSWCRESGAGNVGLRLAASLWLFWYVRGHVREGERWLGAALAQQPERTRERAEALRGRGALAYKQRLHAEAIRHFAEALSIFRDLGDSAGAGACLANLATALQDSGELDQAMALQHEALTLRRGAGDDVGAASTLSNIGVLHYLQGEYEQAAALLEESLQLYRALGDVGSVAIGLNNLGELAVKRGLYAAAAPFFREGLTLAHEVGEMEVVASCLEGLAAVAYQEHDPELAATLAGGADELRRSVHSPLREQDQDELARREMELRRALGDQRFERIVEGARKQSLEQTVRIALRQASSSSSRRTDRTEPLSRRERDVAVLVTRGLTNREIGGRLQIGERTVETHVRRALKKLGLASRAQLAAWVAAQGLDPSL